MRNFIVNYLPTPVFILLSILLIIILSLLIKHIITRYFPNYLLKGMEHGNAFYLVITNGCTILLAFTIIVLFQNQIAAKNYVDEEASALGKIIINSRVFPQNEQQLIDNAIKNYTLIVINEEWGLMKWGKFSPKAYTAMHNLFWIIQAYTPSNAKEEIFYKEILSQLETAYDNRHQRLDKLGAIIPPLFFSILAICLLLILFSTSMVEEKEKTTLRIYNLFANVVIALFFAIIISFDFPFAGDISVSPKAFTEKVLGQLQH